ncbi:MAG: hypothetical protein WAW36_07110 [Methylovulum miyakonense]|uniref:hypothetical protein n=1 Tax=Methylovulum miyakonense TaxID=645578 RepID=UPI003BB6C3AB
MKLFRVFAIFTLTMFSLSAFAGNTDEAKLLFERYAAFESAFNSSIVDLYADDAIIQNKRTYPTGQIRELNIPAPEYKNLIKSTMPLAKTRGDYSTYSEITFTEQATGVRIKAKRFSVLKKYYSPISILVAPDSSGHWLIREELSESQPF